MNEKIIDKLRKLVALSKSPNENEAASAAEKVQALLAEHNLSMADLAAKTEKGADFIINKDSVTNARPWRRSLGTAVARLYFCSYFFVSTGEQDQHAFVGERHNIEVARWMFDYLVSTVDRLAKSGARELPKREQSAYKTSFRWACSQRLCSRISQRIRDTSDHATKTTTGTTLPALASLYEKTKQQLDAHIEQEVGPMKTSKVKPKFHHAGGTEAGHAAGNKIGLDAQVGNRSESRQIGRTSGLLTSDRYRVLDSETRAILHEGSLDTCRGWVKSNPPWPGKSYETKLVQ